MESDKTVDWFLCIKVVRNQKRLATNKHTAGPASRKTIIKSFAQLLQNLRMTPTIHPVDVSRFSSSGKCHKTGKQQKSPSTRNCYDYAYGNVIEEKQERFNFKKTAEATK